MSSDRKARAPQAAPVPPQNLEAEESVLGAMMLSPRAIDAVSEVLVPEDFYRATHATIYRAALALHIAGDPVDAITLTDALEKQSKIEEVGGRVRLHELAALVPATANAGHYARIVRDTAMLRAVIRAGGAISQLGWAGGEAADVVEQAEGLVFEFSQQRARSDLIPVGDALTETWARLMHVAEHGRHVIGTPSGYTALDALTSGYQPGNLVIVAARPSMGKSALALCTVAHVAIHLNLPVALFTLEMNRAEVTQRLLSTEGFVESQKIRNGQLDSDEWRKATAAAGRIQNAPLFIDDSTAITVAELRSRARRFKLRHPTLALVVVDYLQLMTHGGTQESRQQEVSQISRALKVLAGELDVPVLALSQLSRGVEQRHDKRPILSDLRDSGALEQDADVVAFIYRDEYYNPEDTDQHGIAEVIVAKQRNGPTDVAKLSFLKRFARFSDLALPGLSGSTHS